MAQAELEEEAGGCLTEVVLKLHTVLHNLFLFCTRLRIVVESAYTPQTSVFQVLRRSGSVSLHPVHSMLL